MFKVRHMWFGSSALSGLLILLLAGFFAVRNVSSWPTRINYPGEESYEGAALAEITRLAQSVPIYAPPSEAGFAGATYGPLYFITSSHLIDPAQPSYRPLRLLSALAILGCACGCACASSTVSDAHALPAPASGSASSGRANMKRRQATIKATSEVPVRTRSENARRDRPISAGDC